MRTKTTIKTVTKTVTTMPKRTAKYALKARVLAKAYKDLASQFETLESERDYWRAKAQEWDLAFEETFEIERLRAESNAAFRLKTMFGLGRKS